MSDYAQKGWDVALREAERKGNLIGLIESLASENHTLDSAMARYKELRAEWAGQDEARNHGGLCGAPGIGVTLGLTCLKQKDHELNGVPSHGTYLAGGGYATWS
jgi:hypothetical protein